MTKTIKQYGRFYTPNYIVKIILDFGGYSSAQILQKHIMDNSCGDGAFLREVVHRYCTEFQKGNSDNMVLKKNLETYIHGIEIDERECQKCIENMNRIVLDYGITNVAWDILCADTLTIDQYDHKMDFIVGNPPYVRVHNLEGNYDTVKQFVFAENGMTDLFIVFFEIGFQMLSHNGKMCLITPSSWLNSKAGGGLRQYVIKHGNLSGIIDLEHFQPFNATTYTMVSRFDSEKESDGIEYHKFDDTTLKPIFQSHLTPQEILIDNAFYIASAQQLETLREVKSATPKKFATVKNGFATLSDKIFIGDFDFNDMTIDILKASTGKWSKCIFPYDAKGNPLSLDELEGHTEAFSHLLSHKEQLSKQRDIASDSAWFLFGRTQALRDVSKKKYAINTVVKNIESIRLEQVDAGKGIYSGLYILTETDFKTIQRTILSEDFIHYVKMLKKYKNGGYYTFSSKDLEQFLNFKLTMSYE